MEKETKKLLKVINGMKDEELKKAMMDLITIEEEEEPKEEPKVEEPKETPKEEKKVVEPEVKEEPKKEPTPKEDLEKVELKKQLEQLKKEKEELALANKTRLDEITNFLKEQSGFGFKAKPLPTEDKEEIYDFDKVTARVTKRRG